jgi:hypothetical protein
MRNPLHFLLLLALAAIPFIALSWSVRAQDCTYGSYGCGHAEHHEQTKTWKQPDRFDSEGFNHGGMSCCAPEECRPVRAQQLEDGRWIWWNGTMWSEPVRPEAMLETDKLGDGRTWACGPKPEYTGGRQITYCFSPAQVKM